MKLSEIKYWVRRLEKTSLSGETDLRRNLIYCIIRLNE